MKAIKFLAVCLMLGLSSANVCAQMTKEQVKEREELKKYSKAELSEKVSKDAKKQAKIWKKEGWKPIAGGLPLERQADRSYMMQYEFDNKGDYAWYWGTAQTPGATIDAAKAQALELAQQDLCATIQKEITVLTENKNANEQLTDDEAASVVKTVQASKSLISQSLGRTIVVVTAYRVTKAKTKEVMVRVAYSTKEARKRAMQVVVSELKKEGNALGEKLDEMTDW